MEAADNIAVASVQIRIDGDAGPCPIDTSAPYECTWQTRNGPEGSHSIDAEIIDAADNLWTTSAITITVDSSGQILLTTVDTEGNVGDFPSLAIGEDGYPVISYFDATNTALKVQHCRGVRSNKHHFSLVRDRAYAYRSRLQGIF